MLKKGNRERVKGLNENSEGFENKIKNIEWTKHGSAFVERNNYLLIGLY